MKKQLIINADDFGIHPAVNEAVRRAATEGILTSTSLMAGGDAFDEAVEMARSMPSLGIGIHLTLVGGIKPVLPPSEVPSLTWDNGVFCHDYGKLIVRDLEGKISLSEVYAEWDAQIQKIMNTGLPVTHMDGHPVSYTHLPVVRGAVKRGIPVISEVELGYRITKAPILGVTGTNGKTTTTTLLGLSLIHI